MAKIAEPLPITLKMQKLTSPVKALKDQGHDVTLIETQSRQTNYR